ncbi:MAG TPA: hypothetical protein VF746_05085 [Longimicrobium sp.]
MIRARTLPLAGLLVALAAVPAAAQQGEMVPRELVMTLLGSSGSSSGPQLLVGRLPADFPAALAPADARVVGSLVRRTEQTVVFALPQPRPEAAAAYRRTVEGAGWTSPPSAGMVERQGFLAPSMGTAGPPAVFCQGERVLHFSTLPREGGGSYLRLDLNSTSEYSPCSREAAQHMESFQREFPIPALHAPENVEFSGGSMSSGGPDFREVGVRLTTPMAPAELAAHYAAQLRQAGWTPSGNGAGEGVALQTFLRRDASGQGWHAVLSAIALPGSDRRDLSLRVSRVPNTGS